MNNGDHIQQFKIEKRRVHGKEASCVFITNFCTHDIDDVAPRLLDSDRDIETEILLDHRWLRDQCSCAECVHQETLQKQFNPFAHKDIGFEIKHAEPIDHRDFKITWGDDHVSQYHSDVLRKCLDGIETLLHDQGYVPMSWWDEHDVQTNPPKVAYEDIMNSREGLRMWMLKLRQFGFCLIPGCPKTPEGTEKLLKRVGPIRDTHYGAFWEFTADLSSKDTAYTSIALDPHTDTTYFTEPAGLQLLHMLSHTEGTGGETTLKDGFRVAKKLMQERPATYQTLSHGLLTAHASGNENVVIKNSEPFSVLQHDPVSKMLTRVRWNTDDRDRLVRPAPAFAEAVNGWYIAATVFQKLIYEEDPAYHFRMQLEPGTPIIFDNWRVLHARDAFTGKRQMCGGYVNHDDYISAFRTTNTKVTNGTG